MKDIMKPKRECLKKERGYRNKEVIENKTDKQKESSKVLNDHNDNEHSDKHHKHEEEKEVRLDSVEKKKKESKKDIDKHHQAEATSIKHIEEAKHKGKFLIINFRL